MKNRQIAYDLSFLRAVLNWATLAGDEQGEPLLARNPLAGLPLPEEKNPKRPSLSESRYQAMLEVAAEVDPRFGAMLVIAWETGHRIRSIRHLQWRDVDLEGGTVLWRSEYDKSEREHWTPLSSAALRAFEKARSRNPGIGEAWIFPAPKDPTWPCSRYLVTRWWRRAEALAGLEPIPGLGWHGCRRAFATALKAIPRPDLLRLGGWAGSQTLEKCYLQPDLVTMREALEGRKSAQNLRASTVRIDSIQRSGDEERPHPDRKVQAGQ